MQAAAVNILVAGFPLPLQPSLPNWARPKSALLQLQLAKRAAGGNFYRNSVIDERLEKWRAEEEHRKNDR